MRPRPPIACALLSGLVFTLRAVHAQSPADRASLQSLQDTLPLLGESPELDRLAAGSGDATVTTVRLIREGLILLRRAELGEVREPYDQALRRLERALDQHSDWPWPWYALGLTRLAMWGKGIVVKATPYHDQGISYRRAAMDAFARAIKTDSSFVPASEALAGLIVAMGHRLLDQDFGEPLRRAATAPAAPPAVALARFRLDFNARRYEAGLEQLAEYLRRGGDSAVARLEQSRTLQALRAADAPSAYLDGLRTTSMPGRQEYRADLAWVAADWELAEFDSLAADDVAEWVTRFWQERDALALRQPGERLAEHLRRWVLVHQNYLIHRPDDAPRFAEGQVGLDRENLFVEYDEDVALVMTNLSLGTGGFASYRRTQWEVDDRGVIYLRHGEPSAKAMSPSGPPNESWAYDLPEGRRVFHFLGSRALGTAAATTLTASLPPDPEMLDSRAGIDTRYAAMAADLQRRIAQARSERMRLEIGNPGAMLARMNRGTAGRQGAAAAVQTATLPGVEGNTGFRSSASALKPETIYGEIGRGRAAIAAGVTTDGFPLHFKEDLNAVMQVYGVGFSDGERRRVLAVFAVPGRKLVPRLRPDGAAGLLYPVTLRLIAMDREHGIVRQLDTTRVFLTHDSLKGSQHLTGLVEMEVPPGRYQIRTLLTAPGVNAASGTGRDSVEIPAAPTALTLSDLILGREESGLNWPYRGDRIPLNPLDTYPEGSDATLFYEIGGLLSGMSYQVRMAVRRSQDRSTVEPLVETSFLLLDAVSSYQAVNRGLGLSNLKPGAYLLEVTVKEIGSGREVSQRRALNVMGRR